MPGTPNAAENMIKSLTFITGNQAKAEQLARYFNMPVKHKKLDLDEIQSLDLEKIVEHKTRQAHDIINSPVLVEDVSLKFHAFGNLPGPLIRWFLEELGNKGLCRILNHYRKDRSAIAEVIFGFFDGKNYKSFSGQMSGKIAAHPRGESGFGWDPVFIPDGSDKTWSEMNPDEQKKFSMRKIALKKLEDYLEEI